MDLVELAEKNQINKLQILLSIAGLLIGILVYLIDRLSGDTYFIFATNPNLNLYKIIPNQFGFPGNILLDFYHIFSFIVLTAGIVSCNKRTALFICFTCFFIGITFEPGQYFNIWPLKFTPDGFDNMPLIEACDGYFRFV